MADTKKPKPDSDTDSGADTSTDDEKAGPAGSGKKITRKTKPVRKPKTDIPATHPKAEKEPTAPGVADTVTGTPVLSDPAPVENSKRGGFTPALIGGFLAACLGFLAARTEVLDPILPNVLKSAGSAEVVTALQDADARQSDALAALKAEIASIEQPDLGPVNKQLSEINAEIALIRAESETRAAYLRDLEARMNPLDTRLEELEKQPMTDGASQTAIEAYDRELAGLRDAIAAQRADVEKMIDEARATEAAARALEANAATAARNAQNQATSTRLLGALNNGAPYASILAELASAGVAIPDALNASAGVGVATLASLADAFPVSARAALSAARDEQSSDGGIGGFFRRQLGARSVVPREGDDPDAILSRAEAAVTGGDLSDALTEIATLPEAAGTAMQGWVDIATTRLTALQAADQLAQSLNTN